MTVDRTDVAHAERLEERRRLEELAHRRLERLDGPLGRRADDGHVAQPLLELALAAHVRRVETDRRQGVRQVVADAADETVLVLDLDVAAGIVVVRLDTVGA